MTSLRTPPLTALRDLEHQASELAQSLPALLAEAERLSATLMSGAHGRKRSGTGETFWQYRDYTINDPASSIDWRQSARSPKRLYVRETEWETAATVRFWCGGLDGFAYGSDGVPTKRWRSLVISLALAFTLMKAGEHIGKLPSEGPARRGPQGVIHLAESLLSDPLSEKLPPIAEGATHAVYASDFYFPTTLLLERIKVLGATGIPTHFVEVADPMEAQFPFDGHTVFHAPSADSGFRFGKASDIRAEYADARFAHREAIRAACGKFGITFISHSTENPPGHTLSALHHAIGKEVL